MNKLLFLIACFFVSAIPNNDPPQATISNGIITAKLYLPDAKSGYYRAARFDWAGQISELRYKGHNFFGKWFEKYDPMLNDAIMGPVEAFDPIGYDEAPAGGRFVKIGIGALEKPLEAAYFFANDYRIVNGGTWRSIKKSGEVTFIHTLRDSVCSYTYTKNVKLSNNKPELVLYHSLKNNGARTIETNVMNHNFFVIDSLTTSEDFVVSFPFELQKQPSGDSSASLVKGKEIHFEPGDPHGKLFFLGDLTGYAADPKDYHITLTHVPSGAAATITADRPFEKLNFWASVKTICPEPFIHIIVAPGETFNWTITYQFAAK